MRTSSTRLRLFTAAIVVLGFVAWQAQAATTDGGTPVPDAGTPDSGMPDAGTQADAGMPAAAAATPDAGTPATDGGTPTKESLRPAVFTQELKIAEPDTVQPEVRFRFSARVDRVLTSGQVKLTLVKPTWDTINIRELKVFVNDSLLQTLNWEEVTSRRDPVTITIPPPLMSDRNTLTLRMEVEKPGLCDTVPEGTWRAVKNITLITEGAPLPLPNNLALLPVPFVDRDYDKEAVVPFVIPDVSSDRLELAGLVASWFGTTVAQHLSFPVRVAELPETSAIVLVDSAEMATSLGLPIPEGPSARMIDHPKFPGTNLKLLVLAGRDAKELRIAAFSFAVQAAPLAGELVRFTDLPSLPPTAPYDAPRWVPPLKVVPFEQFPVTPYSGTPSLTLNGANDGSMTVRFRLAPDVWTWPTEFVDLDLGYTSEPAPGTPEPRLDLDFNGNFIATLPSLDREKGETVGRVNLRVRAEQLRGFNELQLHVRYPRADGECVVDPTNDSKVTISPDSVLHLEKFDHFANLPDISMFVHDGYPFTRYADLSETAIILPPVPQPDEISTALSAIAHFGTITGRIGSRVTVLTSDKLAERGRLDKDLLLVGLYENHPLIRRWTDRLPLVLGPNGGSVQLPKQKNTILQVWNYLRAYIDLERARSVLFRQRKLAAAMEFPSPMADHRSVVIVTASNGPLMPAIHELTGAAESRVRSGDLLLSAGNQRWTFRIGPIYGDGKLSFWTAFRRFFAAQWILMFPAMLIGSILIAIQLRAGMGRRIKRRLDGLAK